MPGLSSVLVVIAVAAGTFAILTVLVSHLRYQHWLYEAEELATSVCTPDAAALLFLDRMRRAPFGLIRLRLPESASESDRECLLKGIRAEDLVLRMTSGELWVLLNLEPHHLPTVANRLRSRLEHSGIDRGRLALFYPDPTPESIGECTAPLPTDLPNHGWRQTPETWPFQDENLPPPASPAIDPLTGTLSPTRAPRAFRGILAVQRRRNSPLSVLRVDVDQLHEYNSGPGGENAGDAVLQKVASVLMENCREDDLVARLEGDEFLICIQDNEETALRAAQRISESVKQAHAELEDLKFRFTVSIGIAAFPSHGETPRALVTGAGLAREAASARGRGSCRVYHPDMRPASTPATRTEARPESF